MNERCPFPALQIIHSSSYIPVPLLIEEIKVAVRSTRVNQAGARIDKELKVRGLVPSGGTISIGGHGWHYIPFRHFRSSRVATYGLISHCGWPEPRARYTFQRLVAANKRLPISSLDVARFGSEGNDSVLLSRDVMR